MVKHTHVFISAKLCLSAQVQLYNFTYFGCARLNSALFRWLKNKSCSWKRSVICPWMTLLSITLMLLSCPKYNNHFVINLITRAIVYTWRIITTTFLGFFHAWPVNVTRLSLCMLANEWAVYFTFIYTDLFYGSMHSVFFHYLLNKLNPIKFVEI